MLEVKIINEGRMGCAECGHYPDDLKLIMVQVVYPHAKADLCRACVNKLRGKLNEVILDPGQVEESHAD